MKTDLWTKRLFSGTLGWILLSSFLFAQHSGRLTSHSLSFSPGFFQIKDEFNYGLAHSGCNLAGDYRFTLLTGKNQFDYEAGLGLGINSNQGVGIAIYLKPFDVYYGFNLVDQPSIKLLLGPYMSGYYMWQAYPELQAGHMFWLSSYELGPGIEISTPLSGRNLVLSLTSSVFSINSRPEMQTETYYYSLKFSDFAANPHKNMTTGFQDHFEHIDVALEWKDPDMKFSLGYAFEYIRYPDPPSFRYLSHSIILNWKIVKS